MPITLVTGPANAAKAEVVLDAVRRHLAHGDEPLLVVPTRADAEHYTRELAADGAIVGVRVERFAGLIEQLVARSGGGEQPLRRFAQESLLAALAARRGNAAGAGFVGALSDLVGELEIRRVTPARLQRAVASLDGADAPALGALGGLYRDYRAALERLGRPDAELRAVRALDALRERPALWGATPVLLYGFDDLTALQLDVIETLGRIAEVTVSLAYEPGRVAFAGRAASFNALAPLAAEHRALPPRAEHYAPAARAALSHLERSLFEPQAGLVEAGAAVQLLEGGGERAELELVAGEIATLLGRGVPAEEIALLARPGGVSVQLLEEVLRAAGIPLAARPRLRMRDTSIGRALLGLLRCVPVPLPVPLPDGVRPGVAARPGRAAPALAGRFLRAGRAPRRRPQRRSGARPVGSAVFPARRAGAARRGAGARPRGADRRRRAPARLAVLCAAAGAGGGARRR
jgi:ATP-dependent helicase/DNAse subunit B